MVIITPTIHTTTLSALITPSSFKNIKIPIQLEIVDVNCI